MLHLIYLGGSGRLDASELDSNAPSTVTFLGDPRVCGLLGRVTPQGPVTIAGVATRRDRKTHLVDALPSAEELSPPDGPTRRQSLHLLRCQGNCGSARKPSARAYAMPMRGRSADRA